MRENKRDVSIQLIRIMAMFMIMLDHILMGIDFPMKNFIVQVANSGTFIFLFLSGFLYGKKHIDNWPQWYVKRITRICIPMWIFMIADFVIEYIVWGNFELKHVFIYMFNLQGILGVNSTGASLWFLTLIMICYLITPLLQKTKSKKFSNGAIVPSVIATIAVQIISAYATDIGMVAGHTVSWCILAIGMYSAGYFAGEIILPANISVKRICLLTVIAGIASAIVLVFNFKFDGQVIYDRIVIFYGLIILDCWICTVIRKLGSYINKNKALKIIECLDKLSYEIYIVHVLVIMAVTYPLIGKLGVIAYLIVTALLSFVAAWGLHYICDIVYRKTQ